MWEWLKSWFVADPKTPKKRSSKWPKVRAAHLKVNPECAMCGSKKRLEVHHIVPFHIDATKELEPTNLITLCEGKSVNCHLLVGHLKHWEAFNPHVVSDAAWWNMKFSLRRCKEQAPPFRDGPGRP